MLINYESKIINKNVKNLQNTFKTEFIDLTINLP